MSRARSYWRASRSVRMVCYVPLAGDSGFTRQASLYMLRRVLRAKPTNVIPKRRARSTAKWVGAEGDSSSGSSAVAALRTMSAEIRPLSTRALSSGFIDLSSIEPIILSTALWRPISWRYKISSWAVPSPAL